MTLAQDYLHAIVNRARVPMQPFDFPIDWDDMPRRFKYFPGVEAIALDDLDDDGVGGGLGPGELAAMLRDTYADRDRRLALHANSNVDDLPKYKGAAHARGVASGGGRYPVSIYWVAGRDCGVTPGIHYYSTPHHAMQRLQTGDLTGRVAAALGTDHDPAGQYLVLGIKYWQNSFKYNSFAFHAVSMDIGTVTEAWRLWGAQRGLTLQPSLWFDEPALADLLDIDVTAEGVFAVLPLPGGTPADDTTVRPTAPRLRTGRVDVERSRRVLEFETVTGMQKATMAGCTDRPVRGALAGARRDAGTPGPEITLPAPGPMPRDVGAALDDRRSSFGRFTATPMSQQELADLLHAGIRSARFESDADGYAPLDLVTLFVFVNHVEGMPAGAYRFEPGRNALVSLRPGAHGAFLQQHYYLENYNLEQAGVVVVPAIRGAAVLDAVGDRGYRLVNAVIGAVSQGFYLAAAELALGCGAALGFDNVAYMEMLGIDGTDTFPMIIVMAGHERGAHANYRYEIH